MPWCLIVCVCADDGIALRGLFIIDKEGVVQHATINNLAFGRSVDETLRTLQVRGVGCQHKLQHCIVFAAWQVKQLPFDQQQVLQQLCTMS